MTEKKQVYRFFKVAKELNVGISTLADHLNAKGYDISSRPNEKLNEEMYDILLRDFASEKVLKEKAEQIREKKAEAAASAEEPAVEEQPLLSAEDLRENLFGPKTPSTKEDAPKEETPKAEEPKVEEPKVEEPKPKVEEPKAEEPKVEEDKPGITVVGKIDLDKVGKKKDKAKSTPAKKEKAAEKPAAKVEKPEPAPEVKAEEKKEVVKKPKEEKAPKAKKEQPKAKEKKEEKAKTEVKEVKAEKTEAPAEEPVADKKMLAKDHTPKLGGLTIKGKIDLSKVETKSRKSKSSDSGDSSTKKRRKRRRKSTTAVDPNKVDNRRGGGRNDRKKKEELSDKEIQEQIKQTLADLNKRASRSGQRSRRDKRDLHAQRRAAEEKRREEESSVLEVTEFITAKEFANLIEVNVTEIITKCMELGLFVSINQRLDADVISLLAEEYNYEVKWVDVTEAGEDEEIDDGDLEDDQDRAPIVTVMGHVDHGKTSLLDYIRSANVIAGEAGGITQHIGAYAVELQDGRKISFLDTPGHEAFTAMRARGAKVTDVVIIVIAADDSVMPQTKEAINHAQAAGAPMVFALNKVDKPTANPDRIREQLSAMNILLEDWGGEYQSQEISAKTGAGIDELMEKVLLQAELLELKANKEKVARGTVIEARLDKGRGVVATLLVQNGTLRIGDTFVAGVHFAKVKAMMDERGRRIEEAGPSMPVQILGLSGVPQAGDNFVVYEEEKKAKEIATKRSELYRQQALRQNKHITLEEVARRKALGDFKQLNIIIKGDVDGSIEALADSLLKLSTDELLVNIITKAVGQISESDVLLATASEAIIIGFQVRPSAQARSTAENEGIDIRLYRIIYDAINDVRDALEGMLSPEIKEEINGTAEIREVFKITKVGTVGGCMITNGKVFRNDPVRLVRDGIVIYEGKLASLKRYKDDVKEVATGFECGLQVENYNDIKVGDIVESYRELEVKRTLK